MNRSSREDRSVLLRCLSGNREAAETLVRRFSDLVYHSIQYTLVAKSVPFNRQDLEDLHNTVFLQLFERGCKKLRQYQGRNGCSLASWIRTIAVRTVLDHLRKKGVDAVGWQKKRVPLENLPELKAGGMDCDARMEEAEQKRLVQLGMQRLPPRDRLFMKLHFDQGLSIAEVAETMQVSMGNAYTIKRRAIERLKLHLTAATTATTMDP